MNQIVLTALVTISGELHTVTLKKGLRMQRGKVSGQEITSYMREVFDQLAAKGIFLSEDDIEAIRAEAEANRTRDAVEAGGVEPEPAPGEPAPEPPPAA